MSGPLDPFAFSSIWAPFRAHTRVFREVFPEHGNYAELLRSTEILAYLIRSYSVYSMTCAALGHPGGSFSEAEVLAAIYNYALRDLDFYMTCVYERHRSAEALTALLGQAPIPVGEVYLPNDPPRMFKEIQATKRPCLAFKILAAGRLSERRQWVEEAFRQTYSSIKRSDAVIVGIYDRYDDQPADDAAMCRRFGA